MIAIYRCAACGSARVKVDEKSEGYSITKGLLGTAMFGSVGAVAGINGKKKMYYHCPDCGTTLTYPMERTMLNTINDYLTNPAANETSLRSWKRTYPHIEWNDPAETSGRQVFSSNERLTDSDSRLLASAKSDLKPFLNKDEGWISNILKTRIDIYTRVKRINGSFIPIEDLKEAIGFTNDTIYNPKLTSAFSITMKRLQDKGDIKTDIRDGTMGYYFYSKEERKENALEELAEKTVTTIYKNSGSALCEKIKLLLPENEQINEAEVRNFAYNVFMENALIDDPLILEKLFNNCISDLIHNTDLIKEVLDDNTAIYTRLSDEAKRIEEKRQYDENVAILKELSDNAANKIKQKEKEARKLMLFLEDELPSDKKDITEEEFANIRIQNSALNNAYKDNEYLELLYWSVHFGLLDFDGSTFSLPGFQRDKRDEIHSLVALEEKEMESVNEKKEALHAEELRLTTILEEQKGIYKENAGKFLGAGAKKKKEAKQRIAEIEQELKEIWDQMVKTEKEVLLCKSNIKQLQESLPIDPISVKRQYRFKKYTLIDCTKEEIVIRREILRVLKDNKVPMDDEMIVMYSELLKEFSDSHNTFKDSLHSIMRQMYRDRILLEVAGYYVPTIQTE